MGTKQPQQRLSRKTHGHKKCPRCGYKSYNVNKKFCSKCAYGRSSKKKHMKSKY